jgi:hypothetical protein
VGELHNAKFNDAGYIDGCVKLLLGDYQEKDPDNERLVCCTKMLEAIGASDAKHKKLPEWMDAIIATKPNRPVRFKLIIELLVAFRDNKWRRPKLDLRTSVKMKLAPINVARTTVVKVDPAKAAAAKQTANGGGGGRSAAPGTGTSGSGASEPASPFKRDVQADVDVDVDVAPGLKPVPASPLLQRASPTRPDSIQIMQRPSPISAAAPVLAGGAAAGRSPVQGTGASAPTPAGSGAGAGAGPTAGAGADGPPPTRRPYQITRPGAAGPGGPGAPVGRGPGSREAAPMPTTATEPLSQRELNSIVEDYLAGSETLEVTTDLLKAQPSAAKSGVIETIIEKWITGEKSKESEQTLCAELVEPLLKGSIQGCAEAFTKVLKKRAENVYDDQFDYPPAGACFVEIIMIGIRVGAIRKGSIKVFSAEAVEFWGIDFAKDLFAKLKWCNEDVATDLGLEWVLKKSEEEELPPL